MVIFLREEIFLIEYSPKLKVRKIIIIMILIIITLEDLLL